jgi:hypothetical protein
MDGSEKLLFTSDDVWDEYEDTKDKVTGRLSSAVLDHVRDVENQVSDDYLDPMGVDHVKKRILYHGNDAYQFLYRYYDEVMNNGIQKSDLEDNLRNIARDIDRLVVSREEDLDTMVEYWEQKDEHKSITEALSDIHDPDRLFAVQAHDLACHNNGHTEFVTANPSDFIADGRKELVLSNTQLGDVVDLSV